MVCPDKRPRSFNVPAISTLHAKLKTDFITYS